MTMKVSFLRITALVLLHLLVFSFGTVTTFAYSTSGYSWSSSPIPYYINSAFASSFRTAMKAADATWDAAGADFSFSCGSTACTTSANPNVWSYSCDLEKSIGYYNRGDTGVLAAVNFCAVGSSLAEADTTLNTYYSFTTTGAAGKYDVQDLVTHEFGHWLWLLDLSSSGSPSYCSSSVMSTMCRYMYPGQTYRRSLRTDDKDGIKAIYGT